MKRFKLHVGDITDYSISKKAISFRNEHLLEIVLKLILPFRNVPKFGTFLLFTIYATRNIMKSGKGIVPKFGTKGAYYEEIIII